MQEWSTYTPDGRRLFIRRNGEGWIVQCDEGEPMRSRLLDVALIEAMREEPEVAAHHASVDYAKWVRQLADSLGC